MELSQQENVWIVCLNCEYEFMMDELFTDDGWIGCPLCESKSYRTYTESFDTLNELNTHYHRNDFSDDYN